MGIPRSQVVYLLFLLVFMAVLFGSIHRVYRYGPVVTFAVALCISWIPMQLIARALEQRWLWPPSSQYGSFFWGDSLALPVLAAVIAVAVQRLPLGDYWFESGGWQLVCVALAIAAGLLFHFVLDTGGYTASQISSPTKIYHDLFVYPVFVYFLLSRAPALLFADWNGIAWLPWLGLGAFAIWIVLGLLPGEPKPNAHVNYDWERLQAVP